MGEAEKTGPKDVFLHLFAIGALYTSVVSLGALIFNLVDTYFPDPLEYWRQTSAGIRWPLATLTVVFPLYLWANAFLQKEIERLPEKRELKTRKWLLHLTLFTAVAIIAGDLIALIFKYLEGELTVRFLLKVLAVLIIAASAFLYYGWVIKKETPAVQDKRMNIFVKSAVGAVLIVIIWGYFAAGSPQAERLRRFDERRTSDLQQIQWQITEFWRVKRRLPNSLEELRDELRGFVPPRDPETGEPYNYKLLGELSFEICADFKTANAEGETPVYPKSVRPEPLGGEIWTHGAGSRCFSRTVDPEFFAPYEKGKPQ